MRKTSNVENDKNDFDKNDHNTKSGSFLSSRPWWGGRCGPGQTPEICQFAFAQAENLTKNWENMQKSWRKTQNRCKRKRKNMWATCPKTWNGGKKQAFFAAQIGGGQKWAPYLFRLKSIFYKNTKKQNLLPFLNSYYYQNCCRADSFQHLYINNARKMV